LHSLANVSAAAPRTLTSSSSSMALMITSSCSTTSLLCVSTSSPKKLIPKVRASQCLEFAALKTLMSLALASAGVASAFHKLAKASAARYRTCCESSSSITLTIASSCVNTALICVSTRSRMKIMKATRAPHCLAFGDARAPRILTLTSAGVASAFHRLITAFPASREQYSLPSSSMTLMIASSCVNISLVRVSAMDPQKKHAARRA